MASSHSHWRQISFVPLALALTLAASSVGRAMDAKDVLNYRGKDRLAFLLKGARKEGSLTVYSSLSVGPALRPIIEAFHKKYPGVNARYWRGASNKIFQKVNAEMRANALQADVIESAGITGLMVTAKKLEKFYTPAAKGIPDKFKPKNGLWLPSRFTYVGLGYNTKLVPPGSQPKTYEDLLDPKWKGKLVWRSNSPTGDVGFVVNILMTMGDKKGEAYLKRLGAQKVVNFPGSIKTLSNRVVEGEYPVAITLYLHHVVIAAAKGAPTAPQFLQPVATFNGSLMIPRGVKHPYAAMLFTDFYLSEDGQKVLRKANYFPVIPSVKPRKDLQKVTPSLAGAKENFIDPTTSFNRRKQALALIKKYFR